MMRLPRPQPARRRESTIALINVVFLMLIFFLIAGTLAPPLEPEVALVETAEAPPSEPPDALFVTREGELRAQGETISAEDFVERLEAGAGDTGAGAVKVAPDRELPAARLIEIVAELRAAGAERVTIVTERTEQ